MKRIYTIVLTLIIALSSYAQTDSIRGRQFQLTGKIISEIPQITACGVLAVAIVLEFDVTDLKGFNYHNKTLAVIITCPDFYGTGFFQKGEKYDVVFSDKNQADFSWGISDKSLLARNGLSFDPYAISVKRLP